MPNSPPSLLPFGEQPWIVDPSPMLALGLVLGLGVACGSLAKRVRLPGVTGQILVGFLAGSHGLHLVDGKGALALLGPLSDFALALIAVAVGSHLNLRRLRNAGRRLTLLAGGELTLLPAVVYGALVWLTPLGSEELPGGRMLAALMAALAIETSPATTLALVRETRSRGVLTKTLLASVALSNIACILVFELVHAAAAGRGAGGSGPLLEALRTLAASTALGGGTALALIGLTRRTFRPDRLVTLSLAAVVLCSGLAEALHTSPLLSCLMLGLFQTNLAPEREKLVDSVLANFQPAILAVFFTLAGMKLDPGVLWSGGTIALVLFLSRALGKVGIAHLAMWLDRSPDRVRRNVGLARLPQAGVTIGLLLAVQSDPALAPMLDLLTAVVLAVVTLNEVVGPILARVALLRSGEAGMDRTRLIDFLHEENIVTKLAAATPEQAIERLTQVLVESHQLPRTAHAPLLASVLAREAEVSTVLGGGLMIPHGVLEEGERMLGVMGLSAEGLRFPSPDGQPVHCVVLLATPRGERDRHLEVLAALASSIGRDPDFAARLFAAQSSAHAYEILHDDEAVEGFNYFLDEAPPRAGSPAGGSGAAK